MFCKKILYSNTEKIFHKTLKFIYESNDNYDNLLLQTNTVSVHQTSKVFNDRDTREYCSYTLWSYFTHKDLPRIYLLLNYQKRIHFSVVQMQFIFGVSHIKQEVGDHLSW